MDESNETTTTTTVEQTTTTTTQVRRSKPSKPSEEKATVTLGDSTQTQEERLDNARAEAMHNHAVEHADDPVTSSSDPTRV